MESGAEVDESGLEKPYAEADRPSQAGLRKDVALPIVTGSSKDMTGSSLHML